MNRNQRRLGRQHQTRYEERRYAELEEVLPPKNRRDPSKLRKFTTNKCCYVAPIRKDFGQSTEDSTRATDKYQNVLKSQFGFDPLMPETLKQLKELRKVLCNGTAKVENSSQYAEDNEDKFCSDFPVADGTRWQPVDNAADIDKFLAQEKERISAMCLPETVHISDTPRIKIIAKKFSKIKKNNIELRKVDEKVACVEYDVFIGDEVKPREKLRAFFSIKPGRGKNGNRKGLSAQVPSVIKKKFNIPDEDLNKFSEKEIEIIDGEIEENRSYLDDLKKILVRRQAICEKKNKDSLDLMSLYEMARRSSPPMDGYSGMNFLSKAELQEVKDLIVQKCASSVHGINRRTLKETGVTPGQMGAISQSIVAELWREGESTLAK